MAAEHRHACRAWARLTWGRRRRGGAADRDGGGLFLVELSEGSDPGGRLVVAATRCLVKAKGLQDAGEGEEEQSGRNEDAGVEVDLAEGLQNLVGRGHKDSF